MKDGVWATLSDLCSRDDVFRDVAVQILNVVSIATEITWSCGQMNKGAAWTWCYFRCFSQKITHKNESNINYISNEIEFQRSFWMVFVSRSCQKCTFRRMCAKPFEENLSKVCSLRRGQYHLGTTIKCWATY